MLLQQKNAKKGPIYQSATISTSLPDLLALNDHVHQVGQPDSLVEYQHYMRINGYVWSVTPVEGEVGQRLQFQQPFECSHDFDSDLDIPRLDGVPRLGGWPGQLRLGHWGTQHQHDELQCNLFITIIIVGIIIMIYMYTGPGEAEHELRRLGKECSTPDGRHSCHCCRKGQSS